MNYFQALQRQSTGYAARVVETLWPNVRVRHSLCEFLATVIKRAAHGTTAWSITLDSNSIRVNVGPVQLLSYWERNVWICLATKNGDSIPRGAMRASKGNQVYPDSVPIPSVGLTVPVERWSSMPSWLQAAALEYVDAAAARRKGMPFWLKSHSQGVVTFLEGYLQTTLPRPPGVEGLPDGADDVYGPEGAQEVALRIHRSREYRLREAKISQVLSANPDGALRCEVPGCGFDFRHTYGDLGGRYAHVHHLKPLASRTRSEVTLLEDLIIVCANCHAMIHRGGECRPVSEIRMRGDGMKQ